MSEENQPYVGFSMNWYCRENLRICRKPQVFNCLLTVLGGFLKMFNSHHPIHGIYIYINWANNKPCTVMIL